MPAHVLPASGVADDILGDMAVAAEEANQVCPVETVVSARQVVDIGIGIGGRQVAPRQGRRRGPAPASDGEMRRQPVHRLLGEAAVGGQFAAQDRQQGRQAPAAVQFEPVVPGDSRRRRGPVVLVERANAGVRPHDVRRCRRLLQEAGDGIDQVCRFGRIDRDSAGLALEWNIGRADQRKPVLERQQEDDAAVVVLQNIGIVRAGDSRHDDMAALHQPHPGSGRGGGAGIDRAGNPAGPGTGGVDQTAGCGLVRFPGGLVAQPQPPSAIEPFC